MPRGVLGVLGGMGPEATVHFLRLLVEMTPARRDQDHVPVVVVSDPRVPDRSEHILRGGPDPVPAMVRGLRLLEAAGVDLVVIPCVTAHAFLERLRGAVSVPIMDILEEAALAVEAIGASRVGVLATDGALASGVVESRMERVGAELVLPERQDRVMEAIYRIKAGEKEGPRRALLEEARSMLERGAEVILAGCTEVPLVLSRSDVPMVDPMEETARAVLREFGYPVPGPRGVGPAGRRPTS